MSGRILSLEEARAFYDRFGSGQDLQKFFEDPAINVLVEHSMFEGADSVVELGCGTGRVAERLLREKLGPRTTYIGFDISRTMVDLARVRLRPWRQRARIELTEGTPKLPLPDGACDRFLSTYVLDLLGEEQIVATLHEARRVLAVHGRLCLASLTFGQSTVSNLVCGLSRWIHSVSPRLVGGCRPLRLDTFMGADWHVLHREVVCAFGVCSEVLIAN